MHLYDTDEPTVIREIYKFWITIVLVSVPTWVIAGLGYWVVRKGEKNSLERVFGIKKDVKQTESEPAEEDNGGRNADEEVMRNSSGVRGNEEASTKDKKGQREVGCKKVYQIFWNRNRKVGKNEGKEKVIEEGLGDQV